MDLHLGNFEFEGDDLSLVFVEAVREEEALFDVLEDVADLGLDDGEKEEHLPECEAVLGGELRVSGFGADFDFEGHNIHFEDPVAEVEYCLHGLGFEVFDGAVEVSLKLEFEVFEGNAVVDELKVRGVDSYDFEVFGDILFKPFEIFWV